MTAFVPTRVLKAAAAAIALAGCHRDMKDQPRYEPLETSDFFADGRSSRARIPGTIARGELAEDNAFRIGLENGLPLTTIPVSIDRPLLDRGRERFNIYCSVCHAHTGDGNGTVVRRGFPKPPTYHSERLRELPPGRIFDVVTNGFGAMPAFQTQITPRDRWAIAAYIRALQFSRHASLDDVPSEARAELELPEGKREEATP